MLNKKLDNELGLSKVLPLQRILYVRRQLRSVVQNIKYTRRRSTRFHQATRAYEAYVEVSIATFLLSFVRISIAEAESRIPLKPTPVHSLWHACRIDLQQGAVARISRIRTATRNDYFEAVLQHMSKQPAIYCHPRSV